ncbi:MAG: hypothetical protein HY906_16075 [Deltaproteobacteria bacterium]|nr:hypothetical protein [Deltaproteobacteria bacterium]
MLARAAAVLLAACVVLSGCTREVARISLPRPGVGEATAEVAGGEVVFSLDAEYEPAGRGGGITGLDAYRLTVAAVQGKKLAATTTCSPLRLGSSGWSRQQSAERVRLVGNRLVDCRLELPRGGPTTFKATLSEARKPDIRLRYLDLVVEQ